MARLLDGSAPDPTPLERALVTLARQTCERPGLLTADDLAPLRTLAGDGAIDYALVAGSFHFINRIADLLHVDPEALPERAMRIEPVRRVGVRLIAWMLGRMDLRNRRYERSWDEAFAALEAVATRARGRRLGEALAPLRPRPKMLEVLRLALEEQVDRSTVDPRTLRRVHRTVEEALPRAQADAEGFHARPSDPVEAFAFVGTRYAARTTPAMIAALRGAGWDDLGILDLAIAVADANQWARQHRLLGLPAWLLYADDVTAAAASA